MMHAFKSPGLAPRAVVITRHFNAPVERVWHALTTAEALQRWSFPIAEFRAEVGFQFEFTCANPEGVAFRHHCRVTVAVPQKRLAYTWKYVGYEGESLVTMELQAEGNRTRLTLTHTGLDTFPPIPAFARSEFETGWTELIGNSLKQFVETN